MNWYSENGNGYVGTGIDYTENYGVGQTFAANPSDLIT
jgi:hypothetical protein